MLPFLRAQDVTNTITSLALAGDESRPYCERKPRRESPTRDDYYEQMTHQTPVERYTQTRTNSECSGHRIPSAPTTSTARGALNDRRIASADRKALWQSIRRLRVRLIACSMRR